MTTGSGPRIVVLVNDSFFSAEAFRPIATQYRHDIALVVLSQATIQSKSRLWGILMSASKRYVWYRSTIQLLGMSPFGRKNRVKTIAENLSLPVVGSRDINSEEETDRIAHTEPTIGIALNFDQILRTETIDLFKRGLVNSHAGKLPEDRGISPALWAFARGDTSIWLSIYAMDTGVDTGPIYLQTSIDTGDDESAFSMYRRISAASGKLLAEVVGDILDNNIAGVPQVGGPSPAHSWPDKEFAKQLRRSQRRMITLADYRTMLRS